MADRVPLPGHPAPEDNVNMVDVPTQTNHRRGGSTNHSQVQQRLQHHESVMQNMATQLEQIQRMLSSLESRLSGPPPAATPLSVVAVPPAATLQAALVAPSPASSIGAIASRELAKCTFTFAEDQQLA